MNTNSNDIQGNDTNAVLSAVNELGTLYTLKDLISFGKYLLSDKRKLGLKEFKTSLNYSEKKKEVYDADIKNWENNNKWNKSNMPEYGEGFYFVVIADEITILFYSNETGWENDLSDLITHNQPVFMPELPKLHGIKL